MGMKRGSVWKLHFSRYVQIYRCKAEMHPCVRRAPAMTMCFTRERFSRGGLAASFIFFSDLLPLNKALIRSPAGFVTRKLC